jgi:hypothetical protein
MSTEQDRLTPEQRANHDRLLEQYGFDPAEVRQVSFNTSDTPGPTLLSADVKKSALKPRFFVINNIAELLEHGGVPDEQVTSGIVSDSHVTYPDDWDANRNRLIAKAAHGDQLGAMLTDEERQNVRLAMRAYMMGDSSKVKGYEDVINAAHFPQLATVMAAENITVDPGHPLIIKPPPSDHYHYTPSDPYKVIIGTLTIVQGGQIFIEVPANITVQQMVKK